MPRYNLTAMPELIIFAGCGLAFIVHAFQSKQSTLITLRLLLVISALMLLAHSDFISDFAGRSSTPTATLTQGTLLMSIILKTFVLFVFFLSCWRLAKNMTSFRYHQYALTSIFLLVLFTLPAYCLPLRAHGRWYEWSQDLRYSGEQVSRLLYLSKERCDKLGRGEVYLAINLTDGTHLPGDYDLYVNNIKLTGPFIPAMSMAQDLNLVHLNKNSTYTIEQELILKILCDHCAVSPLDLRQWYLIPISTKQGTEILKHLDQTQLNKKSAILPIVVRKHSDGSGIIYGAYNIDHHFSIAPSLFRFSWEKAFYGVENECELNDPAYDQKIPLHQASNNAYIKLLIPDIPTLNDKPVADNLHLAQQECKQENFTGRDLVLSFEPKTGLISSIHKNSYWLIRLFGEVERHGMQKTKLEASLNFSKNISYITPWVPDYLGSNSATVSTKFDICYPLMINAFPSQLKQIELHLTKEPSCVNKNQLVKCSLQVYQINTLPSGVHYEIF